MRPGRPGFRWRGRRRRTGSAPLSRQRAGAREERLAALVPPASTTNGFAVRRKGRRGVVANRLTWPSTPCGKPARRGADAGDMAASGTVLRRLAVSGEGRRLEGCGRWPCWEHIGTSAGAGASARGWRRSRGPADATSSLQPGTPGQTVQRHALSSDRKKERQSLAPRAEAAASRQPSKPAARRLRRSRRHVAPVPETHKGRLLDTERDRSTGRHRRTSRVPRSACERPATQRECVSAITTLAPAEPPPLPRESLLWSSPPMGRCLSPPPHPLRQLPRYRGSTQEAFLTLARLSTFEPGDELPPWPLRPPPTPSSILAANRQRVKDGGADDRRAGSAPPPGRRLELAEQGQWSRGRRWKSGPRWYARLVFNTCASPRIFPSVSIATISAPPRSGGVAHAPGRSCLDHRLGHLVKADNLQEGRRQKAADSVAGLPAFASLPSAFRLLLRPPRAAAPSPDRRGTAGRPFGSNMRVAFRSRPMSRYSAANTSWNSTGRRVGCSRSGFSSRESSSGPHAAAGEECCRRSPRPVIEARVVVTARRAAELAPHHHPHVSIQAAHVQIIHQGRASPGPAAACSPAPRRSCGRRRRASPSG